MLKLDFIRGNKVIFSVSTNYHLRNSVVGEMSLDLNLEATCELQKVLTENLTWSKHPLYQWGQKKIGALK